MSSKLKKQLELKSTREAFGEALLAAAEKNKDIVVLTADLSKSTNVKTFGEKFPNRFFQVGVAEQNLAGISAGLALSGKIPFMTSYGVFSPGRNWDQIRVSICYSMANVKIASTHAGLATGTDGATHQALEDVAITRVLPNMTVVCPADYNETLQAVDAITKYKGPIYLRLFRPKTQQIMPNDYKFKLGKAAIIQSGTDVTLAGTGPILTEILKAEKELKKRGISCEIINVSTIKPLDSESIITSVKKTHKIISVEDHQVYGGLGSAIAEVLSQEYQNHPFRLKIMGVNDTFGESGKDEELIEKYGISAKHIYKNTIDILKSR